MKTNWTVPQLLELSGGYWTVCALHAGVQLDLFTLLDGGELPVAELARRSSCEPRALGMLVEALAAMDLLEVRADGYANSPAAATWLSRHAPGYQGHIIRHHHHLMESWAHLPMAVKSGRPLRPSSSFSDEEWREAFLMGMFNLASNLAPHVARQLDLGGRRRLLDLGGGPGTYAIHFCQAHPELAATVFDLPTTRAFAEGTIARFNLSERINFTAGNFLNDPIPCHFDAAWLSHILHGEDPAGCARLLDRAVAALEPGGLLLVHEFILDDDRPGPLFPALFSLNMLLGTERGQAYRQGEIRTMMERAGVREIGRLPLDLPGPSGVMAGTV